MRELSDLMQSTVDRFSDMVYTITPARVTSVNVLGDKIESVDVQPQVDNIFSDGSTLDKPEIFEVPLVFPSSAGAILSFPVNIGDPVLLMHLKEDAQTYLETGKRSVPDTTSKFSLQNCVAMPCLYPRGEGERAHKDNLVLKFNENFIVIRPSGDTEIFAQKDFKLESIGAISMKSAGLSIDSNNVSLLPTLIEFFNELRDASLNDHGAQLASHVVAASQTAINKLTTME